MAQTVTVLITDVIDGSPDAQTLRFACHRQHHREAFTLTGLTARLNQLRTGIEAPAAKARRREEQLRCAGSGPRCQPSSRHDRPCLRASVIRLSSRLSVAHRSAATSAPSRISGPWRRRSAWATRLH